MPQKRETLRDLLDELPDPLRQQVFTHASWVEHRSDSYERLAFLGDVVLSLAVSTHLFPRFERYGAGRLTKVRAQAVSGASCARVARELGVPDALRDQRARRRRRPRRAHARRVGAGARLGVRGGDRSVLPRLRLRAHGAGRGGRVRRGDRRVPGASRGLQVACSRSGSPGGPSWWSTAPWPSRARAHERSFLVVAEVDGEEVGRGEGKTKKGAEQEAALHALNALEQEATG